MPSSPRRPALAGLTVSVLLAAGAFGSAFVGDGASTAPSIGAAALLAVATAGMMASLILLAGSVGRGRGALRAAAAILLVVVGGGIVAAFVVGAPTGPDERLLGGLPPGAALLLYGAGLAPAFLVPLLYAWTFDRTTLPLEALERVQARSWRGTGGTGGEDAGAEELGVADEGEAAGAGDATGADDAAAGNADGEAGQ